MPETAENVATERGIGRSDQDAYALRSQKRTAAAVAAGRFAEEIVPVTVPKSRDESTVVSTDEHPRPETTLAALAKLKGLVRPDGTITAGNSSGVNDGAGAVLIASSAAARQHGLTPMARVVAAASAGVAPRVMGLGPIPAIRKVLNRARLTIDDIAVLEINEAFAAQVLAVLRELGLPDDADQVNPNGGAIALGHPLGASGVRLIATAAYQLHRTNGRHALCAMCVGVGQGIALLMEHV
jgi:acetyl-CoA acetyltransferase family protein